jgi:hypothetical protein
MSDEDILLGWLFVQILGAVGGWWLGLWLVSGQPLMLFYLCRDLFHAHDRACSNWSHVRRECPRYRPHRNEPMTHQANDQAIYRGMFTALYQSGCYEVEMTLPQETTSPWLGVLRPGTNYLAIDRPEQYEALSSLIASRVLHLVREPTMLTKDEVIIAGLQELERVEKDIS